MKQHIYDLELLLLEPSVRQSIAQLNQLIADDFVEFGSSGKVYNKQDILNFLPLEVEPFSAAITDFKAVALSSEVMFSTYKVTVRSGNSLRTSLRSSLWKRCEAGWQLFFHQGTKCGH
jgi:hypothetical protein